MGSQERTPVAGSRRTIRRTLAAVILTHSDSKLAGTSISTRTQPSLLQPHFKPSHNLPPRMDRPPAELPNHVNPAHRRYAQSSLCHCNTNLNTTHHFRTSNANGRRVRTGSFRRMRLSTDSARILPVRNRSPEGGEFARRGFEGTNSNSTRSLYSGVTAL
jgi:hypothetical protein